jgi:20S proteasome subunit alpha 1
MKFFYEIPTRILASRLGAQLQKYSQYPSIRTLCVTVTLMGCDEEWGPQVYRVDPSGSSIGYRALAIGAKE